jgi:hypothetical protein
MKVSRVFLVSHMLSGNIYLLTLSLIVANKNDRVLISSYFYTHLIFTTILLLGGYIAGLLTDKPLKYTFISILVSGFLFPLLFFSIVPPGALEPKNILGIFHLSGLAFLIFFPTLFLGGVFQYFLIKVILNYIHPKHRET